MFTIFNIVRLSVYSAVIAWTLIVLGLAAFFEHLIISNDLTRFVPLAIFVATATLIIIPVLIMFGFFKRVLPISQVRSELSFVGLLGILWFSLGVYTASSEEADIECDFDDDGVFEESEEYTSGTYQAQYRVLQAFSLFNAILLLGFFIFLAILALREHFQDRRVVWASGVTSYPWFGVSPAGVSAKASPSSSPLPAPATAPYVFSKPLGQKDQKTEAGTPMRAGGQYIIYIPPPPPRTRAL
ncbi:hypothetical protein FRC03_011984 [Tulasnella sp. 419]|nr:hypothetical protein FRC02_010184 [Tulasnella sp. 418]KAG8966446.1 hypothetical protein FRC03_011984 [Tulasnella sp. 419]